MSSNMQGKSYDSGYGSGRNGSSYGGSYGGSGYGGGYGGGGGWARRGTLAHTMEDGVMRTGCQVNMWR